MKTIFYFQGLLSRSNMPVFKEFYDVVCYPNFNFLIYSVEKVYAFIETMQKHPQVGKFIYPSEHVFKYLLSRVDQPKTYFSRIIIRDYFTFHQTSFFDTFLHMTFHPDRRFFEKESMKKINAAVAETEKELLSYGFNIELVLTPEHAFMYMMTHQRAKQKIDTNIYREIKIEIRNAKEGRKIFIIEDELF